MVREASLACRNTTYYAFPHQVRHSGVEDSTLGQIPGVRRWTQLGTSIRRLFRQRELLLSDKR